MRICKNHLTDHIRSKFGANPLEVPDARIRPMSVLEVKKDKSQYLGDFNWLVKGGFSHTLPVATQPVAEVSGSRSKTTDFQTGFSILGTYLKALGTDPAAVSASISGSRKLAFSFSNVRRNFIDVLQLGQVLSQNAAFADIDNFVLHPALTDKKVSLCLITDVIVSNNFSLTTLSESEKAISIDVPAIAQAVGNANAAVSVKKVSENEVSFEGPHDLTFAFSALELRIDPTTGKFSRGDWMKNLKSATGETRTLESLQPGEEYLLDRILLDDSTEYPLLISL